MVLGKCSGEQRLEQVRGQLLWSALTGCGFANTWTECLRPDSARLQKCDLKAACDLQRKPGVLIGLAASVQASAQDGCRLCVHSQWQVGAIIDSWGSASELRR